ncbi:MAG: MBL fold metallo-hydrolase [Spirochaetia bacterium]|jgi:hydroxyacylglutathione hydrolase|nr:MBL fold metallo-hydrolase [Spirochaetia bacterium]
MKLKQFRYGDGNLAYLIYKGGSAAAIDGGAVEEILGFLKKNSLRLEYVINTHDHWDHTPGNSLLLKSSKAKFLSTAELTALKFLVLEDSSISVFPTPGHTMDSITFSFDDWIITGDTLFNGTVGNCYSGNYEIYFKSLGRILNFPVNTRIFAEHDLVNYALGVAENLDPNNPHIPAYRKSYNSDFVVSTLEMELKVNPFVRFNDTSLDAFREKLKMPLDTDYEKWRAMMTVH